MRCVPPGGGAWAGGFDKIEPQHDTNIVSVNLRHADKLNEMGLMRKMISVLLLLLPILAAACAAPQPAANGEPLQAGAADTIPTLSPPSATDQTGATEPTLAPGLPTATTAIKTEFAPSDPATVNLALGKPQLVEFFAFW